MLPIPISCSVSIVTLNVLTASVEYGLLSIEMHKVTVFPKEGSTMKEKKNFSGNAEFLKSHRHRTSLTLHNSHS